MSRPKPTVLLEYVNKKTSFSNPGHVHNLASKLNEMFNCNEFTVYKLSTGEVVNEE